MKVDRMTTLLARLRRAPAFFATTWRNAFRPIPTEAEMAAADKADKRRIVKRIVMRLSRGNISLKRGKFLTKEMIDERWKRAFERAL